MEDKRSRLIEVTRWFWPSWSDTLVYVAISLLTLALSGLSFIHQILYAQENIDIIDAVLGSISTLVERTIGFTMASSGSVAFFWALVGFVIYIIIWLGINFSTELDNDLAITKYVHPRNVDLHSPLRDLISRTIFRVVVFVVLLFYINLFLAVLLPHFNNIFRSTISAWPHPAVLWRGASGIIEQVIAMHILVTLFRLLLLRKKVFDFSHGKAGAP